jgi:uncharacterized C2H2 Zn-finger protein
MLDWNDMFLLHMRINAQIVMQDLQKTLTWNDILLQQIKENKPYKCSICDVIFAENMNLKWHISSAHEENKPIWSILHHIDPFWSNFIKFEQVWTSLIKFDKVWASLIQFDQVRKSSVNLVQVIWLLQHIKENKPYKCSICDVIFAENMNLKWHISSAHEENKSIWPILHHIDPFWSNFPFQVWTSLIQFDQVRKSSVNLVQV